jgi:hypothetical protein
MKDVAKVWNLATGRNTRVLIFLMVVACLSLFVAPRREARALPFPMQDEREFAGTINNTLKVRITLKRNGEVLTGSYSYERIGKSLRLNGKLYDEKEFSIDEFDERGTRTGNFTGKFVTPDWIEGYWEPAATGKKQLPFSAMVQDGEHIPAASAQDQLSGQYRRVFRGRFDKDAGTLNVWLLKDGRYRVEGVALWVGQGDDPERRPVHVGDIDGVFALQGRKIIYEDTSMENGCRLTITFGTGNATITDDNAMCGGVNVTFDGEYKKVGPPHI